MEGDAPEQPLDVTVWTVQGLDTTVLPTVTDALVTVPKLADEACEIESVDPVLTPDTGPAV